MKKNFLIVVLWFAAGLATAQKQTGTEKVITASEKINKKSQQISEASNQAANQMAQAGENAKVVAANVKRLIKVFEPIFKLHFKKKKAVSGNTEPATVNTTAVTAAANETPAAPQPIPEAAPANYADAPVPAIDGGYKNYQPESDDYNTDGSANWGNQYNAEFGNYLDAFTGTILDGGSAEDKPTAVDLIFLAPNDGQNAYYIITPNFAHDNGSADAFWGSATTDNPVKSWKAVNESEVAVTTLTGQQFEKLQYSEQLRGAVKQAKCFASFYSSTTKLEGKVFAVKTEMLGRSAYALIYVMKHVGTSGSSGYLKVKIKCTGFDNNGDGNPDAGMYYRH